MLESSPGVLVQQRYGQELGLSIRGSALGRGLYDAYVRGEIEARDLVTVYKNGPQPF